MRNVAMIAAVWIAGCGDDGARPGGGGGGIHDAGPPPQGGCFGLRPCCDLGTAAGRASLPAIAQSGESIALAALVSSATGAAYEVRLFNGAFAPLVPEAASVAVETPPATAPAIGWAGDRIQLVVSESTATGAILRRVEWTLDPDAARLEELSDEAVATLDERASGPVLTAAGDRAAYLWAETGTDAVIRAAGGPASGPADGYLALSPAGGVHVGPAASWSEGAALLAFAFERQEMRPGGEGEIVHRVMAGLADPVPSFVSPPRVLTTEASRAPAVAAGASVAIVVFEVGEPYEDRDLAWQVLDLTSGEPAFDAPRALSTGGGDARGPVAAWGAVRGEFAVAWIESGAAGTADLRAARFDADGNLAETPATLEAVAVPAAAVAIAASDAGWAVVWESADPLGDLRAAFYECAR